MSAQGIMSEPTHPTQSGGAEDQELIDDQALDWFVLMSSGAPTEEQQVRFQMWLVADPRHQIAYEELDTLDADIDGLRDVFTSHPEYRLEKRVERTSDEPGSLVQLHSAMPPLEKEVSLSDSESSRPRRRSKALWAGAMAACFALFAFNIQYLLPGLMADYHTEVGAQARIDLPDGSVAWLNTDSAIDINYSEGRRQIVLLRGEAQFDVAKNPQRPFSVSASGGRSTALGTVYAVRKVGDSVEVTVSEGTVEVVSPLPEGASADNLASDASLSRNRVLLTHDQQVRYRKGESPGRVTQVQSKSQLAWRQGFIDIRNRSLADALKEIDRYHPGRIVLMADTEQLQPVTARLSITSVDNGLDALVGTQGLKVTRLTDYLVLVR